MKQDEIQFQPLDPYDWVMPDPRWDGVKACDHQTIIEYSRNGNSSGWYCSYCAKPLKPEGYPLPKDFKRLKNLK